MLGESEMHLETTHTMMLHVWHTIKTDIAVVLHVYSFNHYSAFSPSRSTPDPVLTPLAYSIQPSLSTAQFQPESQPAELG